MLAMPTLDPRLAHLARARGGLVTTAEAARVGCGTQDLHRLSRCGELVHLRRGAYALGQTWEHSTPDQQYAVRTRAVLRTRSGVAAAAHSAVALAGLPLIGVDLDQIELLDTTGSVGRLRRKGGITVAPSQAGVAVLPDHFGDDRVPIWHALVSMVQSASDLGAAVALDAALARGMVVPAEILATLVGQPARARWVRSLRSIVDTADSLSPSPEATRLRVLVTDMGFDPRLRVPLRGADGDLLARADLLIGSSIAVVRDAYDRVVLERLHEVGVAVAHVPDADLDHPERVAKALARAMREVQQLRLARGA